MTLINSCKREDESIEKIVPEAYFPAYPGSYWIYTNQDTLQVNPTYEKCTYRSSPFDAVPEYATLLLPRLKNNEIFGGCFIKGYEITNLSGLAHDQYFREILSETQGREFYITSSYSGFQRRGVTITNDTTLSINGKIYENVIITLQYDMHWVDQGIALNECAYLKEYYAKDVGLIRRESRYFPVEIAFKVDFEIVKYEIKK